MINVLPSNAQITSFTDSTTDLIVSLFNNGAIEAASLELHYDEAAPENSSADFG